jgi:hypothetical protein
LAAAFLEVVPRVAVEGRGVIWADLRGLPGVPVAEALLELAMALAPGDDLRAGLAAVPVVAEVAARSAMVGDPAVGYPMVNGALAAGGSAGGSAALRMVERGRERAFLAPLPLSLLASAAYRSNNSASPGTVTRGGRTPHAHGRAAAGPDQHLLALLDGVGLRSCGELAALDLASVEVRFGAEGVRLWRLARGDDARHLFSPIPPERLYASLDFIDYVVTDPERLVFTINALLENLTAALRRRGEHARRLLLTLTLANGELWRRPLRPARPSARREVWLRLARGLLERSTLPDAVAGVALEVETTEPAAVRQGDLFDRGFATAGAVEAALARLLERQGEVLVTPRHTGHPLPERRVAWEGVDPFGQAGAQPGAELVPGKGRESGAVTSPDGPYLSLYLLPTPLPIDVETGTGPGHGPPVRYRDRAGWRRVASASGPDRISGGQWEEEPYAREYFRCITEGGALVWLFRDARRGGWFLHGWWG